MTSFIASPFPAKFDYEAWLKLPEAEKAAALAATSSSATFSELPPATSSRERNDSSAMVALYTACLKGQLQELQQLHSQGIALDVPDDDGWRPIHCKGSSFQAHALRN